MDSWDLYCVQFFSDTFFFKTSVLAKNRSPFQTGTTEELDTGSYSSSGVARLRKSWTCPADLVQNFGVSTKATHKRDSRNLWEIIKDHVYNKAPFYLGMTFVRNVKVVCALTEKWIEPEYINSPLLKTEKQSIPCESIFSRHFPPMYHYHYHTIASVHYSSNSISNPEENLIFPRFSFYQVLQQS